MRVMSGTLSIESEAASASVVAEKHLLNEAGGDAKAKRKWSRLSPSPFGTLLAIH